MSDCESKKVFKKSIVVADDHSLVRIGIRLSFSNSDLFEVVGEVSNGDHALQAAQKLNPDLLLLDVDMPGPGIASLVESLRILAPRTKIVILTACIDTEVIDAVRKLAPDGFVHKDDQLEDLRQALRVIAEGENWTSNLLRRMPTEQKRSLIHLTPREKQILTLIGGGKDNVSIASQLKLKPQTVRNYVASIYEKISVTGRVEAAIWAKENGWNE